MKEKYADSILYAAGKWDDETFLEGFCLGKIFADFLITFYIKCTGFAAFWVRFSLL